MKTYTVYINVSTPVNDYKFKLLVVAKSESHAESVANAEFPKLEPQMTPDNECNFNVSSVEEFNDSPSGIVLSCERIRS